jgi:outer membrane protein OmpA-like peptidoglycan-associated protein
MFRIKKSLFFILIWSLLPVLAWSQDCSFSPNRRLKAQYKEALQNIAIGNIPKAKSLFADMVQRYPLFAKAYLSYGIVILQDYYSETAKAENYLLKALSICPDSSVLAHFYLGKLYFGRRDFKKSIQHLEAFLKQKERQNQKDVATARNYLLYARVSDDLISHPVDFHPVKVAGISSSDDEYLPIISPDNEFALYTRRSEKLIERGFESKYTQIETFAYSLRQADGHFDAGRAMPYPFNQSPNEGAPSLTIDNNDLYYTLCVYNTKNDYLNCDLMHSHFNGRRWTEPLSLGKNINTANSWESQPSVNATGDIIYFSSDRKGGYGGYDLYKTHKLKNGKWSDPENLGPEINTAGHEKSPFIHSDSQTLYFSSDGIPGLGGFDIFYSRMDSNQKFGKPVNIGYPINSFQDDLGFFVSTDGNSGYYASNRFEENKNWNLYSFPLYEKAKPKKVLFIKGHVKKEDSSNYTRTKVEIRNLKTKTITEIPVDSVSGNYVAVVLFHDDQLLTVKKQGYVYESKYMATIDTSLSKPSRVDLELKPIQVGASYKINDIYFATNSDKLTSKSLKVIKEFYDFLKVNSNLDIEIQGHTDAIGSIEKNQDLSMRRARAVYNYLILLGIDQNRLTYKGYGETKPVADNRTSIGRSQNRRTVFVIKKNRIN